MMKVNSLTIFKLLESEECTGQLAPYVLSSEIDLFIESFFKKKEEIIDAVGIDCPEIVTGNRTRAFNNHPCGSVIESHYTGNSNTVGDPVISGAQASGNANCGGKVLPPHKVFNPVSSESGNAYYESNIYHPCLRDATTKGVFQTGSYPKEVKTYTSENNSADYIETDAANNVYINANKFMRNFNKNKTLYSIVSSSFEAIVELQIQDILSALVQSRIIPDNPHMTELLNGMDAVLRVIANISKTKPTTLTNIIHRFGIYNSLQGTVLFPNAVATSVPFICIDSQVVDYVKEELSTILKIYPETTNVAIMTPEQFKTIQSSFPVILDFECSLYSNASEPVNVFNVILTDMNRFKPDVFIQIHTPACVQQLFPGNQIAVPYGSSGKLCFKIDDFDKYDLNGLIVNGKFYNIDMLLNDSPNNIKTYGFVSLKATIAEVDFTSALLELDYVGLVDNLHIDMQVINVLDRTECEIEDFEIEFEVSEMIDLEMSFTSSASSISNGGCGCMAKNVDTENTSNAETETPEEENLPNESGDDKKRYHLLINVPFTGPIMGIRRPDDIVVHKVNRTFDETGECTGFSYEDVTCKFNKDIVKSLESELVVSNKIGLTTIIDDAGEYIITFKRGSLFTTLKVLTESLPAINSEDKLHIAIDPVNLQFAILEDTVDDYPEWLAPAKPEEDNSEESDKDTEETTPDNPTEDKTTGGENTEEPETPEETPSDTPEDSEGAEGDTAGETTDPDSGVSDKDTEEPTDDTEKSEVDTEETTPDNPTEDKTTGGENTEEPTEEDIETLTE